MSGSTASLLSYLVGPLLVALVGSLAYFKRKPGDETREKISVGTAEIDIAKGTVVIAHDAAQMWREIADDLKEQVDAALERITALEDAQAYVVKERDFLRNENVKLKRRIDHQDEEIATLKQRVSDLTRSGVAGPAGPTGEAGESGPQGETGAAGPAGDVGHRGAQGEPGQTGQQGQAGEVGHRGQQGEPGAS